MATVLVVLLAGLSITATTLGVMYTVRSTQDQQMAAHASTEAESLAWAGVELVRLYLAQTESLAIGALTINGINGIRAEITVIDSDSVTAIITGRTDLSSSALQVVYSYQSTPAPNYARLPAGMVFNGDVNYSGGALGITNGPDLANMMIGGNLTIGSGAQAKVSGCAKGNINISGGGLSDNALLYSEKSIEISRVTPPNNATVWGRDINISQTDGSYAAIRAGTYTADAISSGEKIGTALIGGQRQFNSASNSYTNSIIPANTGTALITLQSGSQHTIDLSEYAKEQNLAASSKRISGEDTLPASIDFRFNANNSCNNVTNGICGGTVDFVRSRVSELWGHQLLIGGNNTGGGEYVTLKGNAKITTNGRNIRATNLYSGGDLWLKSFSDQYQTDALIVPSNTGRIAGNVLMTNQTPWNSPISRLHVLQANAEPGLPGIPYCDVRANPVNIESLKSQANYVFYFEGNTPMLLIQDIKKSDGSTINSGPYNLSLNNPALPIDFICDYGNSHCGKNATPSNGWTLTGIKRFPIGIAWFQGNLTLNGVDLNNRTPSDTLINTVLATGSITLTSNAKTLRAPNRSTPSVVCDGATYPSSLCDKSQTPSRFTNWMDENGTNHTGSPLGNIALATEKGLDSQGWTIYGNVVLGEGISTGGAKTKIYGGLSVGGNTTSNTVSQQGGIEVDVSSLTVDQTYVPSPGEDTDGEPAEPYVRWVRPI